MAELDPGESAYRAHQAEREAQLGAVADAVHAEHPHLNLHGFVKLTDTLGSDEADEGLEVYPTRNFALVASDQVLSFMDDPRQLVNGMSVVRYASEFLSDDDNRRAYPIAAACVDIVAEGLEEGLARGEFRDLKAPVIDQWFTAVEDAKEPEVAADIVKSAGVLQNTLQRIVHRDPIRFIDRLHALGMRGLRPDSNEVAEMTRGIMAEILRTDPMAACSLVQGSYFVEDPKKAGVQRRAIDLVLSLDELLGVNMASYYSHDRYNHELDGKDRHLLERHLVPRTPGGRVDWKTWKARTPESAPDTRGQFVSLANTKDGATTTIYGRIEHYRRRNSLTTRLVRRMLGS
jgi:hypothetical protein